MTTMATRHESDEWWMRFSVCKGADPDLFITTGDDPDDEPSYPPPEAEAYCRVCPVRVECLEYATARDMVGIWGGTTEYQRTQLKRKLDRVKCPGCGFPEFVITEGNHQLCLGCGVSWEIF